MLNSCIYEGLIRHRRNAPHVHQFDFRSFLFMLDLDELDSVFAGRWLWSTSRLAFARFKESAHLVGFKGAGSLRARVREVLVHHGIPAPDGPIRLLTQLRYLGFAMNPVSFYYCFDPSGIKITAIVAEVNNTPWGEQHVYVIPATDRSLHSSARVTSVSSKRIEKTFHVSPFMSMDLTYRMAFSFPDEILGVKIENHLDEPVGGIRKILDVSMQMKRKPLTARNLNLMLLKYPLLSFRVVAGIYWQAFRLYLKKTPFYSHPAGPVTEPMVEPEEVEAIQSEPFDSPDLPKKSESESESFLVSR